MYILTFKHSILFGLKTWRFILALDIPLFNCFIANIFFFIMRICNFSQQLVISDDEGIEANELQGKNPCCPACLLKKWRTGRQGSRKE